MYYSVIVTNFMITYMNMHDFRHVYFILVLLFLVSNLYTAYATKLKQNLIRDIIKV